MSSNEDIDAATNESSDLFITEISSELKARSEELLTVVRKEHDKVKEVVHSFRSKVDKMIDKQRSEYISAYENHMQDVQKELHMLRDKVYEMSNNQTKNERTEKLKTDLINYKDEAIQLETDSDELRVKMAKIVQRIYTVEKSRDWMLRKLRKAKRWYNFLLKEKSKLLEDASTASLSKEDSSYMYEFTTVGSNNNNGYTFYAGPQEERNTKFKRNMKANGDINRQTVLPNISHDVTNRGKSSTLNGSKRSPPHSRTSTSRNALSGDISNSRENTISYLRRSNPWIARSQSSVQLGGGENELGKLVALRTTFKELKAYVKGCRESLHKRPWLRVEKRDLAELLESCNYLLQEQQQPNYKTDLHHATLLSVVCELAVSPQMYEVLDEILNETNGPVPDLLDIQNNEMEEDRLLAMNEPILQWLDDSQNGESFN